MECLDEHERYQNRVLSHDTTYTPEQIAIQALIDRFIERVGSDGE